MCLCNCQVLFNNIAVQVWHFFNIEHSDRLVLKGKVLASNYIL